MGRSPESQPGLLWKRFREDVWRGRVKARNSCAGFDECEVDREWLWTNCRYNPSHLLSHTGLLPAHSSRDASTFLALLNLCSRNKDVCQGARVHDEVVQHGLLAECSDALVRMYARCGALSKARHLFEMHRSKDVVTWTALIAGCTRKGEGHHALSYFDRMKHEGVSPNAVTFACILKVCGDMRLCDRGEKIHDEIHRQGLLKNSIVLGTALVGMYAKCGALAKARELLRELPVRDTVSWNALITGCVAHGEFEQAWICFEQMQQDHLLPDAVTFACILKVCGSMRAADKGMKIHDEIAKQGLLVDNIVLGTALVDMYAKCGALTRARQVLDELRVRDTISWTALIVGHSAHGQGAEALKCFEQMKYECVSPNAVTFASVLKACGDTGEVDKGEMIHDEIAKQGLLAKDTVLGTSLVDMYCKFGDLAKARCVLEELHARDVISWNALIAGYVDHGDGVQALNCFGQMRRESLSPNAITFACALKACASIGALDEGEKIHDEIAGQGILRSDALLGTALVDMYAKCGALVKAAQVLKKLHVRDVISWTALIAGYAEHGEGAHALNCFDQMQHDGFLPNVVTLTCLLRVLGSLGACVKGVGIHDAISRQGLLGNNIDLSIALVNMYAKCGDLDKARQVFRELPFRHVSLWNTLIAGYIHLGECVQALNCFEEMQREGLSPDGATFVCVLSACSRLGLIEDAQGYFMKMSTDFGLSPDLRQYTCMVDGFARVGRLDKALGLTETLKSVFTGASWDSGVWSVLLGACQKWGDVNISRGAFEGAVDAGSMDAAGLSLCHGADALSGAGMQAEAG